MKNHKLMIKNLFISYNKNNQKERITLMKN